MAIALFHLRFTIDCEHGSLPILIPTQGEICLSVPDSMRFRAPSGAENLFSILTFLHHNCMYLPHILLAMCFCFFPLSISFLPRSLSATFSFRNILSSSLSAAPRDKHSTVSSTTCSRPISSLASTAAAHGSESRKSCLLIQDVVDVKLRRPMKMVSDRAVDWEEKEVVDSKNGEDEVDESEWNEEIHE